VWRADTGDQLRLLTGHTDIVTSVTFSPDGTFLVSGSFDGTVRFWQVTTGRCIGKIREGVRIHSIALSPDRKGEILATGGDDGAIKLWDVEKVLAGEYTARALPTNSNDAVTALAFSRDGETLVSGSRDQSVRRWRVMSGDLIQTFSKDAHHPGHTVAIAAVALSPDGRQIASGGGGFGGDGVVIVWNVASKEEQYRLEEQHPLPTNDEWISSLAFSPDGQILVAGAGSSVGSCALRVWNPKTRTELGCLPLKSNAGVYALAFSPDGKLFASAGSNEPITIRKVSALRDASTLAELPLRVLRSHVHAVNAVAFSPDGKLLASGGDSPAVQLWDLAQSGELRTLPANGVVNTLAFSPPQGNLMASAGDTIKLWDLSTEQAVKTLHGHTKGVNCVAFSPDGTLLASGAADKKVKLWNVITGKEIRSFEHNDEVTTVAFSPNGKVLASASRDSTIKLWSIDRDSNEPIIAWKANDKFQSVNTVAFSPDGQTLASGSVDGAVQLWSAWSAETSPNVRTLSDAGHAAHTAPVKTVLFLPNGRQLVSAAQNHVIKLWDFVSGESLQMWTGDSEDSDSMTAIAAAPNGKTLVSASLNTQIGLWDITKPTKVGTLTVLDDNDWAAVEPGGRFAASNGGMRLMHWAVGNEAVALIQFKNHFWEPSLLTKLFGFNKNPLLEVSPFKAIRLPPDATIAPMEPGSNSFEIRLTNRGGGIGAVGVSVNNTERIADARPAQFDPTLSQATLRVNLPGKLFLSGQKNPLSIITHDIRGTVLQEFFPPYDYTPNDAAPAAPRHLYAIVAGISEYAPPIPDLPNLDYAASDAIAFYRALEIAGAEKFQGRLDLELLTTAPYSGARWPNKANFQEVFDKVRRNAQLTDTFIVFLAGHGVSLPNTMYCYPTVDALIHTAADLSDPTIRGQSAITGEELIGLMTGVDNVRAMRKVMILDTCESRGAVNKLQWNDQQSTDETRQAIFELAHRTGFHVLMACGESNYNKENSNSREHSRYQHGLLTYALLQALSGAKLVPRRECLDKDDMGDKPADVKGVDVNLLFDYVEKRVPRLAKDIHATQQPHQDGGPSTSFCIGELSREEQAAVPLKRAKPVVVRPHLSDPSGADTKELETSLIARLVAIAAPRLDYEEVDEMPNGIKPFGTYSVRGGIVKVTLSLSRNDEIVRLPIRSPHDIEGAENDKEALGDKLVQAIAEAIAVKWPASQ
jgi:WD40 repeat protein/uncharacterized caspase-like protein